MAYTGIIAGILCMLFLSACTPVKGKVYDTLRGSKLAKRSFTTHFIVYRMYTLLLRVEESRTIV
jgi:hypothetical protein